LETSINFTQTYLCQEDIKKSERGERREKERETGKLSQFKILVFFFSADGRLSSQLFIELLQLKEMKCFSIEMHKY